MGLFKKIKKQLLTVIEYQNENKEEIVWENGCYCLPALFAGKGICF